MVITFSSIINEIQNLSREDKEELKFLIDKYLIEEARDDIHKNYRKSIKEVGKGKSKFSNDMNELKKMVEE